jgi:hypothetical protein
MWQTLRPRDNSPSFPTNHNNSLIPGRNFAVLRGNPADYNAEQNKYRWRRGRSSLIGWLVEPLDDFNEALRHWLAG